MTDVEAQGNGHKGSEESKALTEDKVPEVKIAAAEKSKAAEDDEFKGLTKEELLRYATDPFWVRLRWILFIAFWLIWLAMLAASVVIIIYAPKCPSPDPKVWWQKGPIYKLNVATFKDSDNDGKGDIKGLMGELDYMVDTGINTILLSDIFKGTEAGNGEYGVIDYMSINPDLGTKADWDNLFNELHARNIKVIVDLPVDRTSEQHEWFELSAAREPEFADFYVWQAAAEAGWNMQAERGEAFYVGEGALPQLNLKNEKVVTKLEEILKYWMDSGVNGFNIDSFNNAGADMAERQVFIKKLRSTIDSYSAEEQHILVSLGDRSMAEAKEMYGDAINENHVGELFHLVGFAPMSAQSSLDADIIAEYWNKTAAVMPANAWPTFSASGSGSRIAAANPDMVDAVNMLSLLLPATPVIVYGEELGLEEDNMNWVEMQNNQTQAAREGRQTHYTVFSSLQDLRHQEAILFGDMKMEAWQGCLVLLRVKKGNPGYLLIINFREDKVKLDLQKTPNIAENLRMLVNSVNGVEFSLPDPDLPKSMPSSDVVMEPRQARIFTFVPVF